MTVLSDLKEIIANKELFEAFNGKSVLVTGASGLIGSMLLRSFDLANAEYGLHVNIFGLARDNNRTGEVLGNAVDRIKILYSDNFEIEGCFDYIIHTASPTKSKFFIEHPVETIDTILDGTKNMLELAKKNYATFVYLSSMEEYGVPYEPHTVMTEDKVGIIDHLTARSCYPEGKRMCECMCAAYTSEYGLDTKIVRLAQTFGAGIPLTDNRVSMQFAKSVVDGENIVLHTEGRSVSNFCYLTDAIVGILTIAIKGSSGEAYNVCNDQETRSIYDIAKLVADDVAGGKIDVIKDIPEKEDTGYAPDNTMVLNSKKLEGLKWKPKVRMVDGYRRLVEYLIEQRHCNCS